MFDPGEPAWLHALTGMRHDLYHRPEFLVAEAERTRSSALCLLVEDGGGKLLLPFLRRPLPYDPGSTGATWDLSSPYGYPGVLVDVEGSERDRFIEQALALAIDELRDRGACSGFLRLHPLWNRSDPFAADRLVRRGDVVISDLSSDLWQEMSPNGRRDLRRVLRFGFEATMAPLGDELEIFLDIYFETMRRVDATQMYFGFDERYFRRLADGLPKQLHVCTVHDGATALCSSLFSEFGGIVHYLFSGTRDRALKQAPSYQALYAAHLWFKQRGNFHLNLGGGLGASHDNLFRFKAKFSPHTASFSTLHLVLNEPAYGHQLGRHARATDRSESTLAASGHFPAYRA